MEGADPASFRVLDPPARHGQDRRRIYNFKWKDRERIFRTLEPHINSFQLLGQCGYSKDLDHVYYDLEIVPETDPATFKVRMDSCHYGDDAGHASYQGEIVEKAR